jgi:transposase
MARTHRIPVELIEMAEEVAANARNARDLRRAQAVLLPGVVGFTLPEVARLIGRSRATVARLQAEFRATQAIDLLERKGWGGRRRSYLSWPEEEAFLAGYLELASAGEILVVGEVKSEFELRVGHEVAESTVYRLLARHGWSKIVPRPRHPKASAALREEFKKNFKKR